MNKKATNKSETSVKQLMRVVATLFGIIFVLSGFEHLEKHGSLGMSIAYIVIGIAAFGWVILSFLDDRRARIREEKLEEARIMAEILSAPLAKYNDEEEALEKATQILEKKYGK